MKAIRTAAAVLALVLMLSLTGCYDASYFFSFADEQDLGNDEGSWVLSEAGTSGFGDFGLYLNGAYAQPFFMITGDFTITASFWLGVNAEKPGSVMIMLSDPAYAGTKAGSYMEILMDGLGTEAELLTAEDGLDAVSTQHINEPGLIVGLNRGHWNDLVLIKKGDNIKLRVNDRTLANFDLVNYASENFMLTLFSTSDPEQVPENPVLGFILKDVKVEYMEGNLIY